MDPAGKWEMVHPPTVVSGPHAFTVITMFDDSALVYRCGDYGEAGISYTAQVRSFKLLSEGGIQIKLCPPQNRLMSVVILLFY